MSYKLTLTSPLSGTFQVFEDETVKAEVIVYSVPEWPTLLQLLATIGEKFPDVSREEIFLCPGDDFFNVQHGSDNSGKEMTFAAIEKIVKEKLPGAGFQFLHIYAENDHLSIDYGNRSVRLL